MRTIWVKIDAWDKTMVTAAIEGGADGLMLPPGCCERARALGKIQIIAEDGDLVLGKDVIFYQIRSAQDEPEILRLSRSQHVILKCSDWTVIPLENLVARGARIIAPVQSAAQAQTVAGILEKGVDHILLDPGDAGELKRMLGQLRDSTEKIDLTVAEISAITAVGMGDRICVDTCTAMQLGQGMLVGNSSRALFLVHCESVANPYVAPRPFRVNAGPVHAYTRVPGGKTRYLSELGAGDPVLIADSMGNGTFGVVGRIKIERRPLLLVSALADGQTITTIVQNAETIRLISAKGAPVSVVALKPGDPVLVAMEDGARHAGHKIQEALTEK